MRRSNHIALIFLFCAGMSCSLFRPKPPQTWQLVLQVGAPSANPEAAVNQTIYVIQNRLQALGVENWAVINQGNGKVLVKLPDVQDRNRLKYVLTTGGKLELAHVVGPPNPAPFQTYSTKEEAIASLNSGGTVPTNRRVLPYTEREDPSAAPDTKWVLIESPPIIDGRDLRDASAVAGSFGENYDIQFSLSKAGAAKFEFWTGANINEYLGVVLNDEVKSIAYIKSQMSDQGIISGRFTKQSAEDLALVLKSGALPAPIKIVSENAEK